jgi:glutathione-regulated potassium-efflux system protein KefB
MAADYLQQAGVFLAAAVVAVPICARLGLGSVLGYLVAGVVVGPMLLNLAGDTGQIRPVAEFGVVVMLFLVGLEVRPKELWRLRGPVFGLGGLQILLTAIVGTGFLMALGLGWQSALAISLAFSVSSTAIVLQSLAERGLQQSESGQNSFAVLLFQDIAVIPILALLPLLAVSEAPVAAAADDVKGFAALPIWAQAPISLAVIAGIIVGARFLLRPIFRVVASTGIREIFTATALFVVVGISVLMGFIDMSPALGAFIGGVVLADSEYRHELESDLDPFKGLLLGLFFITVGAGIDFSLFVAQPISIVVFVVALMAGKAAVIYVLAGLWKVSAPHRWTFSLGLGQAGEFTFVLISLILAHGLLSEESARLATLVAALSMALTPLVYLLNDLFIQPRFSRGDDDQEADDPSAGHGKPVVIAGFGRFGQLAGRMLKANGFDASILDLDPNSIRALRKHGLRGCRPARPAGNRWLRRRQGPHHRRGRPGPQPRHSGAGPSPFPGSDDHRPGQGCPPRLPAAPAWGGSHRLRSRARRHRPGRNRPTGPGLGRLACGPGCPAFPPASERNPPPAHRQLGRRKSHARRPAEPGRRPGSAARCR